MKLPRYFTSDRVAFLREHYPNSPKWRILKHFPKYSWRSLQNIANFLRIKRGYSSLRRGNLARLLDCSNESLYWLGLIATDGWVGEDGTLKIDLNKGEAKYLRKFANYLSTNMKTYPAYQGSKIGSKGICRVKVKDVKIGKEIRSLFKITGKKTYNPISIEFISTKEHLASFFSGMIDGDGGIGKNGIMTLDMHINYKDFLKNLGNLLIIKGLIKDFGIVLYDEMVRLYICKSETIKFYEFTKNLNLPLMKRKWSRI